MRLSVYGQVSFEVRRLLSFRFRYFRFVDANTNAVASILLAYHFISNNLCNFL